MPSLAKLVLPVDFSERSVGAAHYARALAQHFQSEFLLVHVLAPLYSDMGGMEVTGSMLIDVYRTRTAGAERELDAFAAAHLSGLKVRRMVLHGEPSSKIVELAHQEGAGLIAMPTHGYGPFRRFILGSNTAKVLHDSDCPVCTGVHMEASPAKAAIPFRRILCALDLGSHSAGTLAWAAWLSREFQAALTLVHAVTAHVESLDEPDPAWRSGIRQAAEEEICKLQHQAGTDAEVLLEPGEPAKVICAAAGRVSADVLVIGRGSAAGAFGRLRTNAYAIIRQSPCPVVSV
jgi:nucleotide-binding universal stress UspA family protein